MNKEIEMLYKTIDAKDKIINEQALEIARLKETIDKAIEYIKNHSNNCMFELRIEEMEELLEILGDKENE